MSPALENLVIGILTSIITGVGVWLWQKTRRTYLLSKTARFFGISAKEKCFVVMTRNPDNPSAMSHNDIYVLIEAAKLVHDLEGEIVIAPYDLALEGTGEVAEFCIGGPEANPRSKAHMERFLNTVSFKSFRDPSEPLALVVGEQIFTRKPEEQEFALLARIFPKPNSKPIFLICGQVAITNRAAMYFLQKNHERLAKKFAPTQPFCFVLEISLPKVYGHKMVELAKDVTATAIKQQTERPATTNLP